MFFRDHGVVADKVVQELVNATASLPELEQIASQLDIQQEENEYNEKEEQYKQIFAANSQKRDYIESSWQQIKWLNTQIEFLNEIHKEIVKATGKMSKTKNNDVSQQTKLEIKNKIDELCHAVEIETRPFDEHKHNQLVEKFTQLINKADEEIDLLSKFGDVKWHHNQVNQLFEDVEYTPSPNIASFSNIMRLENSQIPIINEISSFVDRTERNTAQDLESQIVSFINSQKNSSEFAENSYDDQITASTDLIRILDSQKLTVNDMAKYQEFLLSKIRQMNSIEPTRPINTENVSNDNKGDILVNLTAQFKDFLNHVSVPEQKAKITENELLQSFQNCVDGTVPTVHALKKPVVDPTVQKMSHSLQKMIDECGNYIPEAERLSIVDSYQSIMSEGQIDDFIDNSKQKQNSFKFEAPAFDTSFITDFKLTATEKLPQSVVNFLETPNSNRKYPNFELSEEDKATDVLEPLGNDPTIEASMNLNVLLRGIDEIGDQVQPVLDTSMLNMDYHTEPVPVDTSDFMNSFDKSIDSIAFQGLVARDQAAIYSKKLKSMAVIDDVDDSNEKSETEEINKLTDELNFLNAQMGRIDEMKNQYLSEIKSLREKSSQITSDLEKAQNRNKELSEKPPGSISAIQEEIAALEKRMNDDKSLYENQKTLLTNKLNSM